MAAADTAIRHWAESQWTSAGCLFAEQAATVNNPALLFNATAVLAVGRWWLLRRRGQAVSLLDTLGTVVPISVLATAFEWLTDPAQPPIDVTVYPAAYTGFDPSGEASQWAPMAAGHIALFAAALGLLAWALAGRLRWRWRVTVWTAASIYLLVCTGSWVYLCWSRTSETLSAILIGTAWAALNVAIWSNRGESETSHGRIDAQATPPVRS